MRRQNALPRTQLVWSRGLTLTGGCIADRRLVPHLDDTSRSREHRQEQADSGDRAHDRGPKFHAHTVAKTPTHDQRRGSGSSAAFDDEKLDRVRTRACVRA